MSTTVTSPLDSIQAFMRRFIVFSSDAQADVLALWILHTWAFGAAKTTPYIYVTSAERGSGKTRVIEVLNTLARNPQTAANLSGASMFRVIEAIKPTLFVDEVDTIWSGGAGNELLRGVLNSGYKWNGNVLRADPTSESGVTSFSTFCPKLLAGIDNAAMPDTIMDRSIKIMLKRRKLDGTQPVEDFFEDEVADDIENIRKEIETWYAANVEKLVTIKPERIPDISDRAFEISRPLLAIAERNKGWSRRARAALTELLKAEEKPLSVGAMILLSAKELMEETNADRIHSAELAEKNGVSPKRLSAILAPYGIQPTTIRIGTTVAKGYYRETFTDAWERYL